MKKYILSILMILILIIPIAGASNIFITNNQKTVTLNNLSNEDFSHTVFVEYGTTTTCPYCPKASSQLYSIFNSGDLNFYYVSLVLDKNNKYLYKRGQGLGITSVPDVYFDGKYKHILGAQTNEQSYRNAINYSGKRTVPDIGIDLSVVWKGGGTLQITANVINNEQEEYNGQLRVYIIEKVSRWNDITGKPYHFGVLYIPIDKNLKVLARNHARALSETYTFKKTWYGALYGFSDITKENTIVIASVFDKDTDNAIESTAVEPSLNTYNLHLPIIIEKLINYFSIIS